MFFWPAPAPPEQLYKMQLLTYLKLTNAKLGYILNFGTELMKDGIIRIAMASEVFVTVSKDWEERCYQRSKEKYELDMQSMKAYERKQGRQEGKLEVIELLKSGKSPEQILKEYEGNPAELSVSED